MIVTSHGPGKVDIKTPAKLNLFLEVVGKRADGFHNLETIMHTVDLFDEISITRTEEGISFSTSGIDAGPDSRNLGLRAAQIFFNRAGCLGGAAIHLHKNIPVGAGLGGGSSDAAAVLVGLNLIAGEPLARHELIAMGNELGSDMAFFFACGTALCTGRGENVEPIEGVGPFRFSLVYPGFPSITRDVFQNLNLVLTKTKNDSSKFIDILRNGTPQALATAFFNRLEEAAFRTASSLRLFRELLKSKGLGAYFLSGSGSTFFRMVLNDTEKSLDASTLQGEYSPAMFDVRSYTPSNQ